MNLDGLSYEEVVEILEKTLKYLEPEELQEVVNSKRNMVNHAKKNFSDALSNETFNKNISSYAGIFRGSFNRSYWVSS